MPTAPRACPFAVLAVALSCCGSRSEIWGAPLAVPDALDETTIYWTTHLITGMNDSGKVLQEPLAGGTPVTLASFRFFAAPAPIAVNASRVFWGEDNAEGHIMTVPLGGGTPVTVADGQWTPSSIAADEESVYWSAGSVMKATETCACP